MTQLCELRLYSPRGLAYSGHVSEPFNSNQQGLTKLDKAVGKHLLTPRVSELDIDNDSGYISGTIRDLETGEDTYRVRIWILVEYEPEKL